ncbi:hypothetical protein BKA56DRAFT_315841 [Ilyonectria sp. MPI-CAGE-AT-0026]|nr:hypothetical protein BKA56DRAFT_315841 [Ilyonectria sp. MPI-CAGE-AT-0026]
MLICATIYHIILVGTALTHRTMASSQDACAYSCDEPPEKLEPYGDIAGIGVILSFLITAFTVVAFLTVFYLVFHNPDLDPSRPMQDMTTETQYPNSVDRAFLHTIRRGTSLHVLSSRISGSRASQLESTLNKCILMFADIQIFTGIVILVSGLTTLQCRLSEYHWQILVHLAWFASITHLAALTFLRHYLHNHPTEKTWRLVAMLIMLVLLVSAIIPTSHFKWSNSGDYSWDESSTLFDAASNYAVCSYRLEVDSDTFAFQSMLISILLLIYGYLIRLAKMRRGFAISLRGLASAVASEGVASGETTTEAHQCLRKLAKKSKQEQGP